MQSMPNKKEKRAEKSGSRFFASGSHYLLLAALPLLAGIVLKVLFGVQKEGVSITGAQIFFTLPMPWMDLPITESQINTWLLLLSLYFLVRYLTFDLQVVPRTKRQILAEWLVEKTESLVRTNMGAHMMGFVPFIGAVLALSAFSSLLSLIGLFT
ncbi:MAG: hypothetical protein J5494_00580, partial [Candidatus Methanomethylophilaceae archaeon]|nr:hypothetical protein [Candidatus Methanomethylophilaceae archaeon]